jgi:transcriptional regulator with XRE-family HTH domain
MPNIKELIERRLGELKMSKRELARQVGIHYTTIDASDEKSMKIGTLQKISEILDIPMSEFFQENKAEISERQKYKLAEELLNMAAELVPEYKKTLKRLKSEKSKKKSSKKKK